MQIILFLLFVLLVISLFTIQREEFSLKTKIIVILTLIVIISLASWYELGQDSEAEITRDNVNAFLQGKTLTCKDVAVSKEEFDYVSGTQTFVPKRENKKYQGIVLEAIKCEVQQ